MMLQAVSEEDEPEREPAYHGAAAAPQPAHLPGGHPLVKQPQDPSILVNSSGQQV